MKCAKVITPKVAGKITVVVAARTYESRRREHSVLWKCEKFQ
jgi:hypothetical protein